MAKARSGIEIPIIPEDFVDPREMLNLDLMELYMQWVYECIQERQNPADWATVETGLD
jgi:hypothetical protein